MPDVSHLLVKAASQHSCKSLVFNCTPTLFPNNTYTHTYTHTNLHMCKHTYFTAVNCNICNKTVIGKLPSVLVFPPKRNISVSCWANLRTSKKICASHFSSAQLPLQITNAIKMALNDNRTQPLAKSQLALGFIYSIGHNGLKTPRAPSREHRAFSASISSSAPSPPLTRSAVFHLLWKCLPQAQHSSSHCHSCSAAPSFTLTLQTTPPCAGRKQDVRQKFKFLGSVLWVAS